MTNDNLGDQVIREFGTEWSRFEFLDDSDRKVLTDQAALYLAPINQYLKSCDRKIQIADFGAGSGRWSEFFLPYAATLFVVEPSDGGFQTLTKRFENRENVLMLNQRIEDCDIHEASLDLAVSLGVIHHIPDPLRALQSIYSKLKPDGRLLCYMYYDFENRSNFYVILWKLSNFLRIAISKLPTKIKLLICDLIAVAIYFPLAKASRLLHAAQINTNSLPLSHYKNLPFKVMRNDSLDRFGTRLEQRFSREEITTMLRVVGFDVNTLEFSNSEPYWTFSVGKGLSKK